jgi:hypothetical protein
MMTSTSTVMRLLYSRVPEEARCLIWRVTNTNIDKHVSVSLVLRKSLTFLMPVHFINIEH